jgi:hypothetical protein
MQWSRIRHAAALVLGSALLLAAPAGATQLVLSTPSFIGFHTVRESSAAARTDFGSKLTGRVVALVRRAGAQSSAQAGQGQHVRSDALIFASTHEARTVLLAWRRTRHARNALVGQGGSIAVLRSHGAVTYEVAWREGDRLGLIALRAGRRTAHAARLAVRYARLADGSLRHSTPRTAWGRALAQIRPDGTFSRQAALDLFALAFGPLPGVHPPRGAASTISSGTLAVQAILPYRAQLTKAERDAVDHILGLPPPKQAGHPARTANFSFPGFEPDPGLQATADGFISAYEAKLGYLLPLTVVAGKTTEHKTVKGLVAQGWAFAVNGLDTWGFGVKRDCIVEISPEGLASGSVRLDEVVAHEVFHCFEFALQGLSNWDNPPDWIEEALAEWAALTVDPVPYQVGGGWLTTYIQTEYLPLFERTYDAVGFWGHVQDATGSLWARIPSILNAADNQSAFVLAGADTDRFLDSWGSSVVRAPGASFSWQMFSPIQPPGFGGLQPYIAGDIEGTGNVSTPPYTTVVYVVRPGPSQELLHLVINGHARLSTQYDYTDLQDAWFCTTSKPCECPEGTDGNVPPARPLGTSSALALSGDPGAGTSGYIASASLDDFCHPTGKPKGGFGPFGCSNGCGNVQGDPHMDTIDGAPYDFQAAGEFTVVKSRTDGLDIQERQQPVGRVFKTHTDRLVSVVTAVAMRVGSATLEFDHSVPGSPMAVRLNKHRIRLRTGKVVALRGGGALKNMRSAYGVAWPDGTQVRVFVAGGDGVSFLIQPAADQSGELTGLLGNFDNSPNDDFVSRGGQVFRPVFAATPRALTSPIGYRAEYKQFGPSWRIKQSQSLFFYPRGESTRTLTIPGFPKRLYPLVSLPSANRIKATRICRRAHVRNTVLFHNCVFDVAATNSPSYGTGAGTIEVLAPTTGSTLPTPSSPGVAPWVELSNQLDTESTPVPSLAPSGAGFVAAYRRGTDGSVQVASFSAGAGGVSGVSRATPVTGWSSVGDPVLFPAAGGALDMLFDGIRSTNPTDPLDGTILIQRNPDGSFGAPGLASQLFNALGSQAALASDGTTPLFPTAQSGDLEVNVGASGATQIDLSSVSHGFASAPALRYDRTGRLWLAWYADGNTPSEAGLYMLQLDPATGQPMAGSSPLHAPGSGSNDSTERLALACTQVCRLVYQDRTGTRLLSWGPGETGATTVLSGTDQLSYPAATYTFAGGLWIAWVDGNRLQARFGDATGQGHGAAIRQLGAPRGQTAPSESVATTTGNTLVITTPWSRTSGRTVWATTANP